MASSAVSSALANLVTLLSTLIPPGDLLIIGIDAGTGSTRVVAQHIHGIHTRESATIEEVRLKEDQDVAISQILILMEDGKVHYGNIDVNKVLEQQDRDGSLKLRERIIRRQKLMLHPGFKHVPDVVHALATIFAEKDLKGATQDLFEDWLRALFNDVRAYFKRDEGCNAGKPGSYWDAIPLEIHISVPAMWNDEQRGIMRNAGEIAARASGKSCAKPRISIREEALCVATYYLDKNLSAKVGSMYIFVDVGDGTLDITTVEVTRAHSKDASMQLRRVDKCSGSGAGAHMVNAGAWCWLLEVHKQGLNNRLKQLRISMHEFSRQFWKEIDRLKREFDDSMSGDPQTARIRGSHGGVGPNLMNEWTIDLPEDAIKQWYDAWTSAADQLLQEHLASLRKKRSLNDISAILTGGGAKSARFVERMKATFTQQGIKCMAKPDAMACANGTLLQHFFPEDELPSLANFYITTKVHRDDIRMAAEEEQKEEEQEGGGTFDLSNEMIHMEPRKVKKVSSGAKPRSKRLWSEKEDKEATYIPDRTKIIGNYSYNAGNGVFKGMEPIPKRFLIDADGKYLGRIEVDLFWSKKHLAEHTSLKDDAGDLIPGVRTLPLVFVDLDDLKAKGFEVHDGDENTDTPPYFDLKAFVEMTGTSEELLLTIHVMKPNFQISYELDGAYAPFDEDRLFEHTQEVWSKGCSHFTSNTTGTSSFCGEDPAEAAESTRMVRQRRCKK